MGRLAAVKLLARLAPFTAVLAAGACGGTVMGDERGGATDRADAAAARADAAAACGNGVIDLGEQCDGEVPARSTCATVGFAAGTLSCDPASCTFDTRECTLSTCGNNRIDPGEECDGMASYPSLCPGSTVLAVPCNVATCKLDRSQCPAPSGCGNGLLDPGEQCDGTASTTGRCVDLGYGFSGGALGCDPVTCTHDLSGCEREGAACGNGVIEGTEQCDGADLQGATCRTRGFLDGRVRCDPVACILLTTDCYNPCGVSRFGYTCQ
ncbi:MAG: hypothetical protein FJ104_01150 [Deltaproteobacteria bacterium]|nr:hypothetical protein [Deltaproteobacteria bacterium]